MSDAIVNRLELPRKTWVVYVAGEGVFGLFTSYRVAEDWVTHSRYITDTWAIEELTEDFE